VPRWRLLGADRGDGADEGCRRPEIGGDLSVDDEQEDDRRDAAHHDRELRVEPHEQREDEGRAEHRDDMLGAEPDGLAPAEALVGSDDSPCNFQPKAAIGNSHFLRRP
jgi:hypothetical protein